jgi:hypothetical protein
MKNHCKNLAICAGERYNESSKRYGKIEKKLQEGLGKTAVIGEKKNETESYYIYRSFWKR